MFPVPRIQLEGLCQEQTADVECTKHVPVPRPMAVLLTMVMVASTHRTGTGVWCAWCTIDLPSFFQCTLSGAHRSSDSRARPLHGARHDKLMVAFALRASRVGGGLGGRTHRAWTCGTHPPTRTQPSCGAPLHQRASWLDL